MGVFVVVVASTVLACGRTDHNKDPELAPEGSGGETSGAPGNTASTSSATATSDEVASATSATAGGADSASTGSRLTGTGGAGGTDGAADSANDAGGATAQTGTVMGGTTTGSEVGDSGGTGGGCTTDGCTQSWTGPEVLYAANESGCWGGRITMNQNGTALVGFAQFWELQAETWTVFYSPETGWGEPELLWSESLYPNPPRVAIDDDGFAMAIWNDSNSAQPLLWAAHYTPGGGWGPTDLVPLTTEDWSGFEPTAAMVPGGAALSVWVENISKIDPLGNELWANTFVPGQGWGARVSIGEPGADAPALATNRSGTAFAVWTDHGLQHTWSSHSETGAEWTTPELIQSLTDESGKNPQVAIDPLGNATAVWWQSNAQTSQIWANRFTADAGWGLAQAISGTVPEAAYPWVGTDSAGNAVVVWLQEDSGGNKIWANRYNVESSWGEPEVISGAANVGSVPAAGIGAAGDVVAVWSKGVEGGNQLWSNRYVPGSGWGGTEMLDIPRHGISEHADVGVDGAGNAIVVWTKTDGDATNLWGNISQRPR